MQILINSFIITEHGHPRNLVQRKVSKQKRTTFSVLVKNDQENYVQFCLHSFNCYATHS
jgi:hypothetical protein